MEDSQVSCVPETQFEDSEYDTTFGDAMEEYEPQESSPSGHLSNEVSGQHDTSNLGQGLLKRPVTRGDPSIEFRFGMVQKAQLNCARPVPSTKNSNSGLDMNNPVSNELQTSPDDDHASQVTITDPTAAAEAPRSIPPRVETDSIDNIEDNRDSSLAPEEQDHKAVDSCPMQQTTLPHQPSPPLIPKQTNDVNESKQIAKRNPNQSDVQPLRPNAIQHLLGACQEQASGVIMAKFGGHQDHECNHQPRRKTDSPWPVGIEDEDSPEVTATVTPHHKHKQTLQPSSIERGPIPFQNVEPQKHGIAVEIQTEPVHSMHHLDPQPHVNVLDASTEEPDRPSPRLGVTKVQKQKPKSRSSSKHSNSKQLNQVFHSADVLDILRRKLEAEHFERLDQLHAERARHHVQLNDVRSKVQEQVLAQQTINERIQTDLEISNDRLKAYHLKFKQMKVYIDGVSNDLHQLRIEQNKMVERCEDIVRDQRDAYGWEKELNSDLTASLKDVERLDNELQSAHVANSLLEERNHSLERQLGDAGGQLAEERTRSMRFQEELANLSKLYAEFMLALEETKSEHSKQLEAVNKVFNDSKRSQEVDCKVEQCLQMINETSRKEDISGMGKSLTELRTTLQALISERFEDLRNLQSETGVEKLAPLLQEQLHALVSKFSDIENFKTQIRDMEGVTEKLKQRNDYLERADLQLRDERDLLKNVESFQKERISNLEAQISSLQSSRDAEVKEAKSQQSTMMESISQLQNELSQLKARSESAQQEESDVVQKLRAQLIDSEAGNTVQEVRKLNEQLSQKLADKDREASRQSLKNQKRLREAQKQWEVEKTSKEVEYRNDVKKLKADHTALLQENKDEFKALCERVAIAEATVEQCRVLEAQHATDIQECNAAHIAEKCAQATRIRELEESTQAAEMTIRKFQSVNHESTPREETLQADLATVRRQLRNLENEKNEKMNAFSIRSNFEIDVLKEMIRKEKDFRLDAEDRLYGAQQELIAMTENERELRSRLTTLDKHRTTTIEPHIDVPRSPIMYADDTSGFQTLTNQGGDFQDSQAAQVLQKPKRKANRHASRSTHNLNGPNEPTEPNRVTTIDSRTQTGSSLHTSSSIDSRQTSQLHNEELEQSQSQENSMFDGLQMHDDDSQMSYLAQLTEQELQSQSQSQTETSTQSQLKGISELTITDATGQSATPSYDPIEQSQANFLPTSTFSELNKLGNFEKPSTPCITDREVHMPSTPRPNASARRNSRKSVQESPSVLRGLTNSTVAEPDEESELQHSSPTTSSSSAVAFSQTLKSALKRPKQAPSTPQKRQKIAQEAQTTGHTTGALIPHETSISRVSSGMVRPVSTMKPPPVPTRSVSSSQGGQRPLSRSKSTNAKYIDRFNEETGHSRSRPDFQES